MCDIVTYEQQTPKGLDIGWTCTKTGLMAKPTPSGNGIYCEKFCDFDFNQKAFFELRKRQQAGNWSDTLEAVKRELREKVDMPAKMDEL